MASLRQNLIMAATALLLAGCGTIGLGGKDYNSLSQQLKKDMSEKEVSTTIGSAPDKIDLVKCVDHSGNPWQCKTWIYSGGRPKNTLRLVFYQTDNSDWRVAAWDLY
jgi:hypothetical protein